MSPFPNFPYPERFRSYEDAMSFLKKPSWELCIPVFVQSDSPRGKVSHLNPDYRDAPFEQQVVNKDGQLTSFLLKV